MLKSSPGMADFRLSDPAYHQLGEILFHSEVQFGKAARRRYASLLVEAMQDVASDPSRPGIIWKRLSERRIGLYHIEHSRDRVPDPPGRVAEPRHLIVFRIGEDGIVDVLGFVHDRMLRPRALRRLLQANES